MKVFFIHRIRLLLLTYLGAAGETEKELRIALGLVKNKGSLSGRIVHIFTDPNQLNPKFEDDELSLLGYSQFNDHLSNCMSIFK